MANQRIPTLKELVTATKPYALRVRTSALVPRVNRGDFIIVEPSGRPPVTGETIVIYLYRTDDEVDAKVAILESTSTNGAVLACQRRPFRMLCYATSEVLAVHRVIDVNQTPGTIDEVASNAGPRDDVWDRSEANRVP